jgi:putative ABC transport system substrate-binding protein
LLKAFHDLGYVEGKNIVLEHRFPAENLELFRTFAQELVAIKPEVIIAVTTLGAIELKKATSTIPIVLVLGSDPIDAGLVDRLDHPGGNVTGLSILSNDLDAKRLELLKEAAPKLSRVALLVDPTYRTVFRDRQIKNHKDAAQTLGLSLWPMEITGAGDIEPVFSKIAQEGADGLIWSGGSLLFALRASLAAAALAHRLPAIVAAAEEVPGGLLMSYGPDIPDFFRRGVVYTDKILKGARPQDLPVEQPTKLKLLLNFKTAKALGLTFPQTLLVGADEVIE